jgi:hypothetical protein
MLTKKKTEVTVSACTRTERICPCMQIRKRGREKREEREKKMEEKEMESKK